MKLSVYFTELYGRSAFKIDLNNTIIIIYVKSFATLISFKTYAGGVFAREKKNEIKCMCGGINILTYKNFVREDIISDL